MNTCRTVVLSLTFTLGAFTVPVFAQQRGIELNSIDKTVNPCEDFYQYACGNWNAQHPIPAEYAQWGRFNELQERNRDTLRSILEDAAQHQSRSSVDAKIGAFYEACMDETAVNALGKKSIKPELARISKLSDKRVLAREVGRLHLQGVNVFFDFGSTPDPDNAGQEIAEVDQSGLGLPEKDYYFRKDDKSQKLRDAYVQHVAKMFQLLGDDPAASEAKAKTVLSVETNLASASLGRVDRRDPQKLHNKMTAEQLEALFPSFDFKAYLAELSSPQFSGMNVAVPDFFRNLQKVLDATSLADIRTYLAWHIASSYAPELSQPFVDENFSFYGRTLTGAQKLQPRWRRCVQSTDQNLGEALGQKYVAQAFAGASKQKTLELVSQIEHEMEADINSLTWMSEDTKKQALVKLHGVTNKIGYPEKWRDYSSVQISARDFLGNVRRCREFEDRRELDKIGKPVDRSEWGMTPPTVNAYYSPLENNINFPAGILQPPFYLASRDEAVNFGGIGAVIGHELTHGFDDQGRQFDADGNLRDWWTKQDAEEFKKRADCIANEYDQFSPIPGAHVNGRLTLGENGADNGGVRLAYMALLGALENGSLSKNSEDGYTPEQRFFLGYAQLWCQNSRPEETLRLVQTNPHSPGRFRVNGVVQNSAEFGKAFGCSAGQPMVAANACRVW